jgi:IS30 family transposase
MARTYRQLDFDARRALFRLVGARRPVGEIADRLGCHRSTIYRELGRNRFRDGDRGFCGYVPLTAHDLARRRRRRLRKLLGNERLRDHVVGKLGSCWSPQQIAGRLRLEGGTAGAVCHETIYRYVYGREGCAAGLYRCLAEVRCRRRRRHGRKTIAAGTA